MDFLSIALGGRRKFRRLIVVDDFVRDCVGLDGERSSTGQCVARMLDRATGFRCISSTEATWCRMRLP
jgi:hypothetical protein